MIPLRQHLMRHRRLAALLVAFALLMKVMVPSGYMIGGANGSLTVELCSGHGPQLTMAMPGMVHHPDKKDGHGNAETSCAFSGLTAPTLAGADPVLLAGAIAFVCAAAFRIATGPIAFASRPHLRPPLRGPPRF